MKNNYIISGILAVAIIILFVLHFTGNKPSNTGSVSVTGDSLHADLPIAYINMDSLLNNYNYYKDLSEIVLRKAESSRASLNQKANALQAEFAEFQKKLDNNAFLSRERAEQEHNRLLKKQAEMQQMAARMEGEFAAEQQKMNEQLRDTIMTNLRLYNKEKKYQIIYGNMRETMTVLIADESYNITSEVLEFLNKKYVPAEKK